MFKFLKKKHKSKLNITYSDGSVISIDIQGTNKPATEYIADRIKSMFSQKKEDIHNQPMSKEQQHQFKDIDIEMEKTFKELEKLFKGRY